MGQCAQGDGLRVQNESSPSNLKTVSLSSDVIYGF